MEKDIAELDLTREQIAEAQRQLAPLRGTQPHPAIQPPSTGGHPFFTAASPPLINSILLRGFLNFRLAWDSYTPKKFCKKFELLQEDR